MLSLLGFPRHESPHRIQVERRRVAPRCLPELQVAPPRPVDAIPQRSVRERSWPTRAAHLLKARNDASCPDQFARIAHPRECPANMVPVDRERPNTKLAPSDTQLKKGHPQWRNTW